MLTAEKNEKKNYHRNKIIIRALPFLRMNMSTFKQIGPYFV